MMSRKGQGRAVAVRCGLIFVVELVCDRVLRDLPVRSLLLR